MTMGSGNPNHRRLEDEPASLDQSERLIAAQKDAFQAAMNGADLASSLGFLVNLVADWAADGRRGAFYVADAAGTGLAHVVGMSEAYAKSINGFQISPESFACGLAIAIGERQITRDVMTDTKWAPWRWIANEHGFRGCWSFPIETEAGKLVGSFAMYHAEPLDASPLDIELAEAITRTAAIIISQHQEITRRVYSEERYRALFEAIDDGHCIIEFIDGPAGPLSDYIHLEANAGYERQTGIADVVGKTISELAPAEAESWIALYGQVLKTGLPLRFERYFELAGRHVEVSAARLEPAGRRQVSVLFRDIEDRRALNETLERRVAERSAELSRAEDQLRQSQKMEAIGQLTGGIAHDFNNMLTGISGSLELIKRRMDAGRTDGIERFMETANSAVQRAAGLTHRLLAFARRQSLDTKGHDLAALIRDMEDMLHRTLGEKVRLQTHFEPGLWSGLTDSNQFENALLNLAINARDAMPDGGKLTIEARNAQLDQAYAETRADVTPGDYVAVSVSDTGVGMSPEVIAQAFEPFFTTKPIGQGTGLGLSVIYGFAKQTGGHVRIHSKPGQGTTITLYIARTLAAQEIDDRAALAPAPPGEGETILVVEDDPEVRPLIGEILRELGYRYYEAADAQSAIKILDSDAPIDLLISDVGLPVMNGRQLAELARERRAGLKVLFVTGYAESALMRSEFLAPGMDIMAKPFVMADLARKVRALIA